MTSTQDSNPSWGSSFRLTASEKWKAKSAVMGRDVTEALVDYAQPSLGMKVLDLASGTGEPAITLATQVGPGGHVTALDLSAELLEIAAQRARQRGLTNFVTRQADAQALPFADQSFDLATCRFGVMFFPDVHCALRDLHRVLKPGARACFAAWGSAEQPYFSTSFGIVHRAIGGSLLAPCGPDPFRFAHPGSLSQALQQSGFADVNEETKVVPWTWPGPPEEVWEQQQAVATPFLPLLKRVPPEKWPEINAQVHAAIRKYETADGIQFTATIGLASGRRAKTAA
jgi:SAM-dependent methyltransferase